jgi:uncharacterized repeat protein (TIGR03803 family)
LIAPKKKGGKWREKVLYTFKNVKTGKQVGDGANPNGGLAFDNGGAIYGTTPWGGSTANNCAGGNGFVGCGTVFELKPPSKSGGAWSEKILYRFSGRPDDGSGPSGGLVFDSKGCVYGTTVGGGSQEEGVLFKLAPSHKKGGSWVETLLHQFSGGRDGALPGGVAVDSAGNIYGVARAGRRPGGVVFRLTPNPKNGWAFSLLYNLAGAPDGRWPQAAPVFDAEGNLYGTTLIGGTGQSCQGGYGTVYEVWP